MDAEGEKIWDGCVCPSHIYYLLKIATICYNSMILHFSLIS